MRAYDLALMLALFGAVMGLLDSTVIWEGGSIDTGPEVINQTVFDEIKVIEDPSGIDLGLEILAFSWTAVKILFNMLGSIIYIRPIIASVFGGGPDAVTVASVIQIGIWATYAIALFQAKTGKSLKGME